MSCRRYKPQAIQLPADSSITRTFYDQRSHLPGKPPLTEADYNGFETHTVFNDVFLDADGQCLRAIGPPLVNLEKHLLPVQVVATTDSQQIRLTHKMANHDRVTFHSFALPTALKKATKLSTTWTFANGQAQTLTCRRTELPHVQLQFATLQKNNPIEWIVDWLRYCGACGVQRVLLYDNGSDNITELETILSQSSDLPDTVLIDWPFPYGPVKSFYNQFCQASQNNHAYQCFGQAQWTGHFDVDEYLVVDKNNGLRSILDNAPGSWGLLRFDSYWVPDVENILSFQTGNSLPTVRDFRYRERKARGKAHKYIARNQRVKMANTHNAKVSLGFRRKAIASNEMAFLHYKPLTNDWRGYEKRVAEETLDHEQHVIDDSVQNQMKKIDRSL